jgi:hypothetical protein
MGFGVKKTGKGNPQDDKGGGVEEPTFQSRSKANERFPTTTTTQKKISNHPVFEHIKKQDF